MKRGRPRSIYALPRLWNRLTELNYLADDSGLIKLKNDNFPPDHLFPHGTMLSNREIARVFNIFAPRLVGKRFAADIVSLVNEARIRKELPELNINDELVMCGARIIAHGDAFPPRTSEHRDTIGEIAAAASYSPEIIRLALEGMVLPRQTCEDIVRAAQCVHVMHLAVENWDARQGGRLPSSEPRLLAEILRRLA